MKILFTSDWQAAYENLELCAKAAEEILQLRAGTGFEVLVLCGDLKHIYNPIDLRVVNFWQRIIKKWIKAGMEVVVVLGNHDRLGMHNEKPNWLPVLRNVGAKCFDQPDIYDLRNGYRLCCLPFRQSGVLRRTEAHAMARHARPDRDILVFHADISGARYNVLSRSPTDNMASEDLRPQRYMYCIGGHLHMQQRVGELRNVWYTGSPFATDWGEANQRKGYLLLNLETKKIKSIRSSIPGWYDPAWPGFEEAKPDSWEGAHVRIKVHCESTANVGERIRRESEIASRNFAGARLSVIPEFAPDTREGIGRIRPSHTDDRKIRIYLQENLPEALSKRADKIHAYLMEQLRQVGGIQREGGELNFIAATARNCLSYKDLHIEFKKGLTVVSGKNKDWLDKSNGSGKTSYLQMIALALFGQTFKGQKHDRWMRRGTPKKAKSFVSVLFKDYQNRFCIVRRSRQPKLLKLQVEGEVIEAGNRAEATQGLIEQITGYTWETLSNAVYVDQGSTHLMLTGTEAQRKSFLARVQNLERFEKAEKRIREDFAERSHDYDVLTAEVVALQKNIAAIKEITEGLAGTFEQLSERREDYDIAKQNYLRGKSQLDKWTKTAVKKREEIQELLDIQIAARDKLLSLVGHATAKKSSLASQVHKMNRLEGQCPMCLQPVSGKHLKQHVAVMEAKMDAYDNQIAAYEKQLAKARQMTSDFTDRMAALGSNDELEDAVSAMRDKWIECKGKYERAKQDNEYLSKIGRKWKNMVVACKEKQEQLKKMERKLALVKFAQSVFQRDGLPAYLNAQVCPELNQAAQEYSELFAQSEIQVRFSVDGEGRMDVQVVNAHGGANVEDQSEGEMKLASLITAFAVRSLAPKTNILILDEPGDGLDNISARNFAKGLREISERFCIILMTTHNPVIQSELADSHHVEVVKRNRISRAA